MYPILKERINKTIDPNLLAKIIKEGINIVKKTNLPSSLQNVIIEDAMILEEEQNDKNLIISEDSKIKCTENLNVHVKIRTSNKELIEYVACKVPYCTTAKAENEKEEENFLDNMRRFVKYNPYDTLGKTTYDEELNIAKIKKYKDKEGNEIPIRKGLLYRCHCGSYELVEECEIKISFSYYLEEDFYNINNCNFSKIKCSVCKEVTDLNLITFVHDSIVRHNGVVAKEFFNDLEERGKITIGSIEYRINFFGDKYKIQRLSHKIVINADTGRSYILPRYDLDTKKRKGSVKQLGYMLIEDNIHMSWLGIKDVINIGNSLEAYIKNNIAENSKAVIPFRQYIKDAIRDSIVENTDKIIDDLYDIGDVEDIEEYKTLNFSIRRDLIRLLLCYNQNPYINYKYYSNICNLSDSYYSDYNKIIKIPSKVKKIRKIRKTNLLQELSPAFNIKSKTEKKYISNNNHRLYAYTTVFATKKVIKDANNINKILMSDKAVIENRYINDLIEIFGETAVVNAITKKDDQSLSKEDRDTYSFFRNNPYDYYCDTIRNYEKIKNVFPEYKLPCKRLRLKELHDKIAKDANKIKINKIRYTYQEELMNAFDNKSINNITFKVALSNRKLVDIGSKMGICVGGYTDRVENGSLFIVYMEQDNEYVGCLEISHNGYLHQAKSKYNRMLDDEKLKALKEYCKMTNLTVDTSDVPSQYKVTSKGEINSALGKKNIKIQSEMIVEDYNVLFSEEEYNVPCVEEI